jgi:hypothetical protein
MKKKLNRRQAEAVFEAVKKRYALHLEGMSETSLDYPKLVEDWEPWWNNDIVPWAILWESGPDEWAYRFSDGGFDEELAILSGDLFGRERTREMAEAGRFTEQPAQLKKDVFVEPGTSFVLCLYPT